MYRFSFVSLVFLVLFCGSAFAAEQLIELTNGEVLRGELLHLNKGVYTLRLGNGQRRQVNVDDVVVIKSAQRQLITERAQKGFMRIAAANVMGERLVPVLLERFLDQRHTQHHDWRATEQGDRSGHFMIIPFDRPGTPKRLELISEGVDAFTALNDGADIGASTKRISRRDMARLISLGDMKSEDAEFVVGLDGIAIVTHPDNPLNVVSEELVGLVYQCVVNDWAELGGEPGPIHRYALDTQSSAYELFNKNVMNRQPLCEDVKQVHSSKEMSAAVAKDKRALGFVSLSAIGRNKPLAIRECDIDFMPTPLSVKMEEYPLIRRLYFYSPIQQRSTFVEDFLEYTLSEEGQDIVEEQGFVSLNIRAAADIERERLLSARIDSAKRNAHDNFLLANFVTTVSQSQRLSVTFRFDFASARLDNRAQKDILRLAELMKTPGYRGKKLLLLGFTDDQGKYVDNVLLSRARANAVARQLERLGVSNIEIKGFGQEAPIACNEGRGRAKNRRVEVWM